MTAVLCRHFGLKHIEIAEDIASDTFLKASEQWAVQGIPDNPTAWLYTVAKNKTKDYFKHLTVFETQVKSHIYQDLVEIPESFDHQGLISDSQLAMIFAVCNPANSKESQICLALQILCGFNVDEISNAFLTKKETIKKRLHRARTNLRDDSFQLGALGEKEIEMRLSTVLKTLYLLFNEGYFSNTNTLPIRKEFCTEAIRLTLLLTENPLTNSSEVNALLALMCFQSSRLEARTDDFGEVILFENQDRNLWDSSLINRGNYYLVQATGGEAISKYHLEAGIAYWHTTEGENKWRNILQLYNQLIVIDNSPITALNRIYVLSQVHGEKRAIVEAEKSELNENSYYHSLLGYLYSKSTIGKSIYHYKRAVELTKSTSGKQTLEKELMKLQELMPDDYQI
ncbi:RNA polymerase subunit sigma [Algoriphagus sp. AGSA1]|uniref:RNA polymerase sigma factor n=1 Tax=Algoriphagus sp. AGSA1 TaxID=2907213 RepID=UPI001F399C00|nr:DUF6596 domain-containing protein [Algoriphagus sp. AGSA1]MCE7053441.1 RNA polymerase subunit sigma [Algoriphagus sp. AGSA1]